jgi:hypothetical protein
LVSRLQISAIILFAAAVWGVSLILEGIKVRAVWLKPFSIVVGALVIVLSVSNRWLWRLRFLRPWLFNMPDIHGTWEVVINPTPRELPGQELLEFMVIRQTLSTISLRLLTRESNSETLSARMVRCDDGSFDLAAVYRNTPRLQFRERSPIHLGAMLLSVQGDPPSSLAGQYWTDRSSQGEIRLSNKKRLLAHSYEEAAGPDGNNRTT